MQEDCRQVGVKLTFYEILFEARSKSAKYLMEMLTVHEYNTVKTDCVKTIQRCKFGFGHTWQVLQSGSSS